MSYSKSYVSRVGEEQYELAPPPMFFKIFISSTRYCKFFSTAHTIDFKRIATFSVWTSFKFFSQRVRGRGQLRTRLYKSFSPERRRPVYSHAVVVRYTYVCRNEFSITLRIRTSRRSGKVVVWVQKSVDGDEVTDRSNGNDKWSSQLTPHVNESQRTNDNNC